ARLRSVAPDARVIVLSGFEGDRMAPMAIQLGASAYLEKGASPDAIVSALSKEAPPRPTAPGAGGPASLPAPDRASPRMRVLVVDDNREVLDTLCVLIETAGHEGIGAVDGFQALELFRHGRYDVVVVDLVMPAMNGLEVIRRLRAIDQNVRVVALTGKSLEIDDAMTSTGIRL